MKLRRKKEQAALGSSGGNGPAAVLLMLEALRLAVLATGAGSGTGEAVRLRAASDHLAEKAMKGPSWPTEEP